MASLGAVVAGSNRLVRQLWLTALLLVPACASPTEYLVNTTSDFSDTNLGDHTCAGRANLCSLRAAIEETNTHQAGDAVLVVVPAGTYDLNGELSLTHDDVTLRGDGRDTTIIRQTQLGQRLFTITTSGNIWIGRVTLRDGNITGSTDRGGAIRIDGTGSHSLTLSECRITNNRAGFRGGGVYAEGANGSLNILNCVVQDNDSTGAGCITGGGQSGGGGILVQGPRLTLIRSEVRDNCGSNGGGIGILGGLNHLIVQSTIAGNGAATRAGGLMIVDAGGRIEDSTIAENTGPEAGGVYISGGTTIEITSVTIVGNTTFNTPGDGPTAAGGINSIPGAQVLLENTVIAANTGDAQDCVGELFSTGGNFVGTLENECKFTASGSDKSDAGSPGLGALMSGIGPTRYMLPNANSPLVNAGASGCGPTDQRGQPAPVGACDIGAVERP